MTTDGTSTVPFLDFRDRLNLALVRASQGAVAGTSTVALSPKPFVSADRVTRSLVWPRTMSTCRRDPRPERRGARARYSLRRSRSPRDGITVGCSSFGTANISRVFNEMTGGLGWPIGSLWAAMAAERPYVGVEDARSEPRTVRLPGP